MKINKIIYWTSPLLALVIYVSMGIISDLIGKNELQEPYPGPSLPEGAINFILGIIGAIVVALGYIITFLYQKLKYRNMVLFLILLLFFTFEFLIDYNVIFQYDFTKNGTLIIFIIALIRRIFLWLSYPLFLVILLYWSSRKERQKTIDIFTTNRK